MIQICFAIFLNFIFSSVFYRLKSKIAWHHYDVLIKNIMEIMRPERLPNPATYWAGKYRKVTYPSSPKLPSLLTRWKLQSLLHSLALPCPQ